MGIKLEWNDFTRALAVVVAMAFVMILVAYGITYIFEVDSSPVPPYIILFFFSIVFVIASVFFEKRGAIYPWYLVGGAIVSGCLVFIITATIGGLRYIVLKGFSGLGVDTVLYSLSISMILSMVLLSLVRHKL